MIVKTQAFPRAGLIGNPSDGFFGRTIAFTFDHFQVDLALARNTRLTLQRPDGGFEEFDDVRGLFRHIDVHGYDDGTRLLAATIKRFHAYCKTENIRLSRDNFAVNFQSTIPYQLGFAGSSAIIIACLRALLCFYGVSIAPAVLANLALKIETDELGIPGGLQDRVVQVYQGLVYMDFDETLMKRRGYGEYQALDPRNLPPLYIAYREVLIEDSAVYHHDLTRRFRSGEPDILDAIDTWRKLTVQARELILDTKADDNDNVSDNTRHLTLGALMNQNFDRRAQLYPIHPGNLEMVHLARQVGASAKFTGSGGAVIGTYEDDEMYEQLLRAFSNKGISVFKPVITPHNVDAADFSQITATE